MKNNNQKVVRKLSGKNLRKNKMRNIFAVAAIALTCMLFTVLASMGTGMMQAAQEQTMREVGTQCHAGLKGVTREQMEKITADSRVKDFSWNVLLGVADNIIKRHAEIRYAQGAGELQNAFIDLREGGLPEGESDVIVDTFVLDVLKLPHEVGVQVPLSFSFYGKQIKKTFTVCGWYEGDGVSHATQLYVSKTYWENLKGNLTDQDFQEWYKKTPQDERAGLYDVGLYFDSARKLEEKVTSVIRDAGYEPDSQVEYGVNWAYMENRAEQVGPETVILLVSALAVIILSGYLIIYNIFQISIMEDIRFYGLLKTIGTTGKQLKRLVHRQAFILSLAGIPIGLLAGFLIGKVLFPFAMGFLDYKGMKMVLHFHPAIIVFGAAFSFITVALSCRRPGKIAGSVSPIEAVRYNEGTVQRKKPKKTEKGARVHKMALSNLGRNKKKTVLVILSMSLSVVLLCVVLTGVGSFRIDSYLEARMVGDVTVGSVGYTAGIYEGGLKVDPNLTERLDKQQGIQSRSSMWSAMYETNFIMDAQALEKFRGFYEQGVLRTDDGDVAKQIAKTLETGWLEQKRYAYDTALLKNLKVLSGELDIEKFQRGGYVLVTPILGDKTDDCFLYEPGDKLTLNSVTEKSRDEELKDENGEIVGYSWSDMESTEYEVMAVVDIPHSMDVHMYGVNGVEFVVPLQDINQQLGQNNCFAVSYELEDKALEDFQAVARDYTENENPYMGYLTKEALKKEFSKMVNIISTMGVALSAVIAFIGILNFINSMLTGIYSRKREFAVLCSIGMTEKQLKRMLLEEGLCYAAISGAVSIVLGSVLSYGIIHALNQIILFFQYRYNAWAFFIMFPLFALIAWAVPSAAYGRTRRESIVERLRETEG